MENTLVVHSDGGARGNPGPGACAFVVEKNGRILAKASKYLGNVTNNIAEYSGVLLALNWLIRNLSVIGDVSTITFLMDSELVARQLMGLYKVKDKKLLALSVEVKKLTTKISPNLSFKNISREENKLADFLVNETLDLKASGNFV